MSKGPRPSCGTIPPAQPFRDFDQAIALLKAMHNFTIRKTAAGYTVQIRQAGKRVEAGGTDLMATIQRAFGKLRGEGVEKRSRSKAGPRLRLTGGGE